MSLISSNPNSLNATFNEADEQAILRLQQRVKELEIISRKITTHLFTGEYHSAFKGKGMSFREVREYHAGDDVRFIDWNVSARFNHPFTKVFEEERELTVFLLIDTSASNLFGTSQQRKIDLINEIAAVLCFSAISNNDKVGAIFFSDEIEGFVAPQKGRKHALYIVRQLLTAKHARKGTDLEKALKYFNRMVKQKSIAFVLSDFVQGGLEKSLKMIAGRHDVIGMKFFDRLDIDLPNVGLLQLEDLETGSRQLVDTTDTYVRQQFQDRFLSNAKNVSEYFKKAGADLLHIGTDEDYVKLLQSFFIGRG
ncbi:MAG: hypothetical protein RLY16_2949 [Bacteroidota bacterium]